MQLTATQQFDVEVVGQDSKGNPAPFENPTFTVSPPELGTFEVDAADPAKGTFKAGTVGTGQLAFTADGIIGEGEALITANLDVTIVPANAVSVKFNVGAVSEQS